MPELYYPTYVKNGPHIIIRAKEYSLPACDETHSYIEYGSEIGIVYLYIPSGLSDAIGSSWNNENINETVQQGIAAWNGKASFGDMAAGLSRDIKSVVDGVSGGAASHALRNLSAIKGQLLRPNDVLVLDNVGRFTINLGWELQPQNSSEGSMVKDLIKYFRKWSRPSLKVEGGRQFLDYPPIFDILIRPTGGVGGSVSSSDLTPDNLFFYSDMVLENYTSNFAGGSNEALFYDDGTPITTSLNLSFKSIRPGYNIE